ncbi:Protein SCAR2 [Morella rubra]|uniref:Protein SCAR n=1 Tax=Morella rubra TaxID=262757 RepID=A0A6A1WJ75_9ROSI|nr:Protein SCAR2 [Morella rubra]
MPLTRYQIRNEYSLADPELYRAADRDDPEALLEGVAMAGLVGVLRQLGDLAEFAAEIFHDLHEEVMVTAARGHGLMVRVQQLEAEVPSIEKALLSQTNHSLFFSNGGVDWHPNQRMEQNLITRGDLPRFVMDSYEECRGPPRLFLLDKFDVAGAGACLKRYTDPSFFKVEAASSGSATAEAQREKRIRKVKKKGSRWRNGETPEVQHPSHAKLHQLFLEERAGNGYSDSARLVKLKRRQLNGSPFDSKAGKSYMEKYLEPPTPEQKVVHEISITSLSKLTVDDSSESALEVLEIGTVSPAKKSTQEKNSECSSPDAQEVVSNPYMDQLNEDLIGRQIVEVPEPADDADTDDVSSSTLCKVAIEEKMAVDGELKRDGSVEGYHSDDLTSELDNYMDALATMESEMDTDNEYRPKKNMGLLTVRKRGRNSDGNEGNLELQAQFSESQSFGNSSASDYGYSSFKYNRSSFSDSDTLSSLAENAASGGDGAAKVFPTVETCAADSTDMASSQLMDESPRTKLHEHALPNDTGIEKEKIPDLGEASCSLWRTDSKPVLLPLDHGVHSSLDTLVGPEIEEATSDGINQGSKLLDTYENETILDDNRAVCSNVASQTMNDIHFIDSAKSHLDGEDTKVLSDALLDLSDVSELTPDNKGTDNSLNKVLQTESADEDYSENLVDVKQCLCSDFPVEEMLSDVVPNTCATDMVELDDTVSKGYDAVLANGINLINLTPMGETQKTHNLEEQRSSDLTEIVPELELASAESGVPFSEVKSDTDQIPRAVDIEEIGKSTCSAEAVGGDAVPLELPHHCPIYTGPEEVLLDAVEPKPVIADVSSSAAAVTDTDDDPNDLNCLSPDLGSSISGNHMDLQESLSGFSDSHKEEMEFNMAVSPEWHTDIETQKTVNQLDFLPADNPYKSGSSEHCHLKTVDGDGESTLVEKNRHSLSDNDVIQVPTYSVPSNQQSESTSPHQSHLLENSDDGVSSPTHCLQESGTPLEKLSQFEADQVKVESLQEDEATYSSSKLQSEQTQSPNHVNQQRCEQIQSSNHLKERCFDASSESCAGQLPCPPLTLEFLSQSADLVLNGSKEARDQVESALPSLGLLPDAAKVNLEEAPPLPPLPPMQWRMGKAQNASLACQRDLVEANQHVFPAFQPFPDEKDQFCFTASDAGIMQHQNPFLAIMAVEEEKSQPVSEQSHNLAQLIPLSFQLPISDSDADCQSNCLPLEEAQTLNPFLTSPLIPAGKPELGFLALGGEKADSNSIPFTPVPTTEYITSRRDPESSEEKPIEPFNQLGPETGSEDQKLQPTLQYHSEGERQNPSDTSMPPQTTEAEHPQHDLLNSDGETPQVTGVEVGKPNGNTALKIPRPPKPLIDAVAAHDKSKMRKVAERVCPRIGPKVDERDSLLEQIRTKSFNLKPAVVARPSIRGPRTNLKAYAGSDSDDDSDSWSDA